MSLPQFHGSLRRILCWWYGHDPHYGAYPAGHGAVPCRRCGITDIGYADLVCDTRRERAWAWLIRWSFRRWWPARCIDCGKRFGRHDDCLPF